MKTYPRTKSNRWGEVKIYLNKGSNTFRLTYYIGAKRKETTATTEELAEKKALQILEDFKDGNFYKKTQGEDSVYLAFLQKLAGEESIEEILLRNKKSKDNTHNITCKEALAEFLETKRDYSNINYRTASTKLKKVFSGALSERKINSVKHNEITKIIKSYGSLTYQRNKISLVKQFYKWMSKKNYVILVNGYTEADKIEKLIVTAKEIQEIKTKKTLLAAKDLQKMLDETRRTGDTNLELFLLINYWTGIRVAEIQRLRKKDFKNGEIWLSSEITKTKVERIVPLSIKPDKKNDKTYENKRIMELLSHIENDDEKLFNTRAPTKRKHLIRKLNIDFSPNTMRRTCASMKCALYSDLSVVAQEMGHSPEMLKSEYKQLATKEQAIEWFSVN